MRIRAYQEKEKTIKERELYLRLRETGNGVILFAVDEMGERLPRGDIVEIQVHIEGARVHFLKGVNTSIGFDLDSQQEVVMGAAI